MNFLRRLFGASPNSKDEGHLPTQVGHAVTVTPRAAEAVNQIAHEQTLPVADLFLFVRRQPSGDFAMDLETDWTIRRSPQAAVATSHGVTVVIPCESIDDFGDLVIDFDPVAVGFSYTGTNIPDFGKASDPGGVTLSHDALGEAFPALWGDAQSANSIAWHLENGDSRAAVVASVEPLVVAAYTDELDAVALLRFPDRLAIEHDLKVGDRLLTVNTYTPTRGDGQVASDLVSGEAQTGFFCNFTPLIADFVADNPGRVADRKAGIAKAEWDRASDLGQSALARASGRFRDGTPGQTSTPAY